MKVSRYIIWLDFFGMLAFAAAAKIEMQWSSSLKQGGKIVLPLIPDCVVV